MSAGGVSSWKPRHQVQKNTRLATQHRPERTAHGGALPSADLPAEATSFKGHTRDHQQCEVNYFEIRRAVGPSTIWSNEFHRRIDERVPPAEGTRPYEKLLIPTDLEIVHITCWWDPAVACTSCLVHSGGSRVADPPHPGLF